MRYKGDSLWTVFWKGGDALSTENDQRSPDLATFVDNPWKVFKSSLWGMTAPWQLTISVIIGLCLMISPSVFQMGIETSAANLNHLGGALVIVFAVVAMAEVLRSFRYFNVLLGLGMAVMPWVLEGCNMSLTISRSLVAIFVIAFFSFSKRKSKKLMALEINMWCKQDLQF
jgi:hypothetical protein